MSGIIPLLLAVFKAVPIIKTWWEQLLVAYVNHQENEIKKDIRDGIKTALDKHDQRELEKAIGSTKVGELSGNPNTTVRPSRPH